MSYGFDTLAIHAGQPNDERTGAVAFPIYQTSTYGQAEPGVTKGFSYSRTDNPTRRALEENLAALEGGGSGIAFGSGLAAASACLNLLRSGDHIVAARDLYGGVYRLFTKVYAKFGLEFEFIDMTNPARVETALRPSTKLLWLESPSNPLLRITDIAAVARIAKRRPGLRLIVDNTFASPYLQRPLDLGADIVLHSTTKYLSGHSDVIGGALVTRDPGLAGELRFCQNAVGAVPGPQDCFLTLRGIKTLGVRMERHCANAAKVAEFLEGHPKIAQVYFPGLPGHPGHEVAKRQQKLFGAMVSFELAADVEEAKKFASRTRIFTLAESLGSVKSLLCHPPTMTHASVESEVRRQNGISDGLIRLSVGIEDQADLIDDLAQALDRTVPLSRGEARYKNEGTVVQVGPGSGS
jgi:cystathionine beta-lyase/cystathionine gamma-synthase